MHLPARARPVPPTMEFAVALAPEDVVPHLLSRPHVAEEGPHGRDPGFELERTSDGFHLTADPGFWRPGTRAVCEARLVPTDGGARVVLRFRLHPLTRTAFAYVIALGLAVFCFQWFIAGPAIAATVLAPFLLVLGLLAADRTGLRKQQRALRTLVESTFTPIALPQERAATGPFRRGPERDP